LYIRQYQKGPLKDMLTMPVTLRLNAHGQVELSDLKSQLKQMVQPEYDTDQALTDYLKTTDAKKAFLYISPKAAPAGKLHAWQLVMLLLSVRF
jgi:hypothetical protein